jgi:hypothetical protein
MIKDATYESVIGNDNLNNEIILWGCRYLSSHGYTLKSNLPKNVQNTPMSSLARFATSDGYLSLKRTPELLALEANTIRCMVIGLIIT